MVFVVNSLVVPSKLVVGVNSRIMDLGAQSEWFEIVVQILRQYVNYLNYNLIKLFQTVYGIRSKNVCHRNFKFLVI